MNPNTNRESGTTPFQVIFDAFYNIVTDDMYLEWTKEETAADLTNILLAAIPKFEFPRFKLYDYSEITYDEEHDCECELGGYQYNTVLTLEEIDILAQLMMIEWIKRQIATVDVTKQKYSSKDFELTSQANHLSKLLLLKDSFKKDNKAAQRLYKRRKTNSDGRIVSNYAGLGGKGNAY